MPDFVTLTCPSCGGKLEISKEIERFACGYCGQEHMVKRGGGTISLLPIVDEVKGIRVSVDKTVAELAIPRLRREIIELDYSLTQLVNDLTEKYFIGTQKRFFNSVIGHAMKLLLKQKNGVSIRDKDLMEKIFSLEDNELDFLVTTLPRIKDYPILYEIPYYKPFLFDMSELRDFMQEYKIIRPAKQAQLDNYLNIISV